MHTVTQGEVVNQLSELYNLIGERFGCLQDLLNGTRGDEADSDSDQSETEEHYTSSDMLSVFDRKALPSEYRVDFPTNAPGSATRPDLYVPGSLAATIYAVAVQDDTFFRHLRKVITPDVCAESYFRKQGIKVHELLAQLDPSATLDSVRSDGASNIDVPLCAQRLRFIVDQIFRNRDGRLAQGPLGFKVISGAAEILVNILYEVVCNRNNDISGRVLQEHVDEDDERDRNLFMYLIGNPPQFDNTAPLAMTEDFIIDRLRDFPPTEWSHLFERLTTILDSIHEHSPGEERAIAYAAKLENMLREYTTIAFEPSSSSVQQRRPTVSSPRESQRRRFD